MNLKANQQQKTGNAEICRRSVIFCCVLWASVFVANNAAAQSWKQPLIKLLDRAVSGKHICTKLSDGSDCGTETWVITVQSDGTKTLRTYMDWSATETQINVFLKTDMDYRPIEAFANVYSRGRLFGSALYVVQDNTLTATVNAPDDYFVETMPLPDNFSLLLHPISADGWHFGYYEKQGDDTQTGSVFTLGAAGRSVLVKKIEMPLTFIGTENITVPAGKFVTEHYRFGEPDTSAEVWVTGTDRVVVKHEYPANDSRWLLTEMEETTR